MHAVLGLTTQLLLVAGAMLVLAACGRDSPADVRSDAFEALRDDVRQIVTDPARAERAGGLVDALQSEFDRIRREKQANHQEFQALNADYDATPTAFDALLTKIDSENRESQRRISAIMQQFLQVATAEEWAKFGDTRQDAMIAAMAALQAI